MALGGDLPVALVFNCHYNGLSIIQELGAHGVPCVAMDCDRSIGTYSKYARFVACPDPSSRESDFVDFLVEFCAGLAQPPVLFPTNDEWAVAVSRGKARLSHVARPCVADWPAVRSVVEKARFYAAGRRLGLPTPRTWTLAEVSHLRPADFPIVAKPEARRCAADVDWAATQRELERLRLTVLRDEHALGRFLAEEEQLVSRLVFQEYVRGASDAMYTVGVYVDGDHVVRRAFTGRKVRGYPADIGDCIVGEVHDVPSMLMEITRKVVAELSLTGILEFEYKRDAVSGHWRLIEVNPRPWSWIGITPACGVSLPLAAYSDLTGRRVVSGDGRVGARPTGTVRYYRVLPDLVNSTIRYRSTYPEWRKTPWEWWREFRSVPTRVTAEFHAGDGIVAVVAIISEIREAVRDLRAWLRGRFRHMAEQGDRSGRCRRPRGNGPTSGGRPIRRVRWWPRAGV